MTSAIGRYWRALLVALFLFFGVAGPALAETSVDAPASSQIGQILADDDDDESDDEGEVPDWALWSGGAVAGGGAGIGSYLRWLRHIPRAIRLGKKVKQIRDERREEKRNKRNHPS